MLVGGGTATKPSVVGDVHHEPGPCTNGFPHQVSEDGVVTDEGRPQEGSVHGGLLSRNKVPFAQVHVVQDGENVVEGNPFAERNQVFLDITLRETSVVWGKQERGIVDFVTAYGVRFSVPLEIKCAY